MGTLSIFSKVWVTLIKGVLAFDLRKKWLSDHQLWDQDQYYTDQQNSSRNCYTHHRSIMGYSYPEEGLDKEGNSQLHLACRDGSYIAVKKIIDGDAKKKLCFVRDKDGCTPLHIAAMKGRLDVLQLLLEACPDSVKEVNATMETCLHTAVVYNKGKTIQYLLSLLASKSEYSNLINSRDYDGNTALHLATSRKQLQSLKVFLTCDPDVRKLVQVNATNSRGLTALDILFVLPHSGKIDFEIEKILRRAGGFRTKNNSILDVYERLGRRNAYARKLVDAQDVLLVTATLIATLTFHAAISFQSIVSKENRTNSNLYLKQVDSISMITTRSFVLFNSTGFIASVCMIIFLLHQFPMKPWPQISVSTLFGSYMCIINVISPREALPLLSLSIPFLLLAAAGKLFRFHDKGIM